MCYAKFIVVILILGFHSIEATSQSNNFFEFKKGMKFHYKGTLFTDTINKYPTDRIFSEKEYNTKFIINDLVISIDTVIKIDEYTFVRFLFNSEHENAYLSNNDIDFFFIPSAEPRSDFNLIFYKNEIYTLTPTKGIMNPLNFNSEDLRQDEQSKKKVGLVFKK